MKANGKVTKYVRFERAGIASYGILEAAASDGVLDTDVVTELTGNIFEGTTLTGLEFPVSQTRLLVPCEPSKVLAVGLNYVSHREHVESTEGVILNAAGRPVQPPESSGR